MNRISKSRQARIDAGEEKLNYGSTIGSRTGERKKPTLDELKKSGLVKKANLAPRSRSKKAGESQVDVFAEIWSARPHRCQVCGHPIREPKASNFSHVAGKGAYPLLKYSRKCLEIWCCSLDHRDGQGCHEKWTYHSYDPHDKNWQRVVLLKQELKEEARKLEHK